MKLNVVDIWIGWIRKSEMTIVRERMLLRDGWDGFENQMRETNDVEKNFRRWAREIWVKDAKDF
jgi:hypothetical protein